MSGETALRRLELETERLLLRQFRPEDAEAHHRQIGSDAAVTWDGSVRALDETRARIEGYLETWRERGYGMWAIIDKETGELRGHAGLQPLEETGEVELAYYLGRAAWGRGFATEAGAAAVRFGFDEVGLERILAVVRPENAASQRVLTKLGFIHDHDAAHYDADVRVWKRERRETSAL